MLAAERPHVTAVQADLLTALPGLAEGHSLDAVVCMRDTLLHLPHRDAVVELLVRVADALAPGGVLVLTYRDLSAPPSGLERFLPVRSDDQRIMTCVVEEAGPDAVSVTDLVHTRGPDGWQLAKSSYDQLRLAPSWLRQRAVAAGLRVTEHREEPSGMWTSVAVKE